MTDLAACVMGVSRKRRSPRAPSRAREIISTITEKTVNALAAWNERGKQMVMPPPDDFDEEEEAAEDGEEFELRVTLDGPTPLLL